MAKYRFGPFTFDSAEDALTRGGREVELDDRATAVLRELLENDGWVASRELAGVVFSDLDDNSARHELLFAVRRVRAALRDVGNPAYVVDHPHLGYRVGVRVSKAMDDTAIRDLASAESRSAVFIGAVVVIGLVVAVLMLLWR